MAAYIVRLEKNQEIVGIFNAETPYNLFWLIDECVDPGLCEYARMPPGGIMWPKGGEWVVESELGSEAPETDEPSLSGARFSESWFVFTAGFGERRLRWKAIPTSVDDELAMAREVMS